ncbi:MAG: SH3 domain-containing protein, partial [Anaerolineae bacterium]|nr:SH3 domain-containing protein [Anaerolineae bacterium]
GVLHVRSGSGTGYESLATVANGTILTVLDSLADLARKVEQQDQWIKVRTAEGVEGYAAAWYLLPYNLEALITHVVITDAQGNYSQGGLWEGEYAVWVNPPAGAMATQPPVVVNLNGCNGAEVNLEYCGQLLMLPVSGFALSTGARLMLAIAGFALVVGGLVFYGSKLRSRA